MQLIQKIKLNFYKFMKKRQNLKSMSISPLIGISNNTILFSDLVEANKLNSYFS